MGSPDLSRGPSPPVDPLTLSSPTKATPFRIILWRCWAQSEHGIAQPNRSWKGSGVNPFKAVSWHKPGSALADGTGQQLVNRAAAFRVFLLYQKGRLEVFRP